MRVFEVIENWRNNKLIAENTNIVIVDMLQASAKYVKSW